MKEKVVIFFICSKPLSTATELKLDFYYYFFWLSLSGKILSFWNNPDSKVSPLAGSAASTKENKPIYACSVQKEI